MSKTINSYYFAGGGGSGGLTDGSALLSVTVPTGSTVTATKSGVTLVPSLWLSGADSSTEIALFVFAPAQIDANNPWTITATDGTATAVDTVIVATNMEYEITLVYERVLFYNGITDAELVSFDAVSGASIGTEITTTINTATGNYWVSTNQLVIPANYSQLKFEIKTREVYSVYPSLFGLLNAKPVSGSYNSQTPKCVAYGSISTTSSDYSVFTVNISQYAGLSYYIGMVSVSTSNTRKIWLSN